jgi:hypothetical protein
MDMSVIEHKYFRPLANTQMLCKYVHVSQRRLISAAEQYSVTMTMSSVDRLRMDVMAAADIGFIDAVTAVIEKTEECSRTSCSRSGVNSLY